MKRLSSLPSLALVQRFPEESKASPRKPAATVTVEGAPSAPAIGAPETNCTGEVESVASHFWLEELMAMSRALFCPAAVSAETKVPSAK